MSKSSKVIIFRGYWNVSDVIKYPHALFIYGDNDAHLGLGGQAVIRGLMNTTGIPTKKYPSNHPNSFYTDKEYNDNTTKITAAIDNIIKLSASYKYVVLPENGIGTGLAKLPKVAPKTYEFLVESIAKLKEQI